MATDLRRRHAALDPGSFEPFYRRHMGEIYRYVLRDVGNRADAEEVTQAAFLDAYRALRRGHEPEQPRAWMYGIARNAARRRYRTQSRRPREVELQADLADRLVEADEAQRLDTIRAALEGLRPSHREVVFLREVEGLSYREIARRMGLSLAAVETLLFRARRSLRALLEAEGFRPATQGSRARGVRGLLVLPAFFTRLTDRAQQLFATELTAKAAGAATAVALGTGVVVGTQALPLDAKASADVPARVDMRLPADSAPAVGGSRTEASSRGSRGASSGHAQRRRAAPRERKAGRSRSACRAGRGTNAFGRRRGVGRRHPGALGGTSGGRPSGGIRAGCHDSGGYDAGRLDSGRFHSGRLGSRRGPVRLGRCAGGGTRPSGRGP
jgi:RNA polymerase sigma factor (sigma-70 family)